jgi:hypothetical protein
MSLARSCLIPFDDVFEFTFALGLFDIGDIMKLQMVATQYDIHFLKQKFRISPQALTYPENEYCSTKEANALRQKAYAQGTFALIHQLPLEKFDFRYLMRATQDPCKGMKGRASAEYKTIYNRADVDALWSLFFDYEFHYLLKSLSIANIPSHYSRDEEEYHHLTDRRVFTLVHHEDKIAYASLQELDCDFEHTASEQSIEAFLSLMPEAKLTKVDICKKNYVYVCPGGSRDSRAQGPPEVQDIDEVFSRIISPLATDVTFSTHFSLTEATLQRIVNPELKRVRYLGHAVKNQIFFHRLLELPLLAEAMVCFSVDDIPLDKMMQMLRGKEFKGRLQMFDGMWLMDIRRYGSGGEDVEIIFH